jgi:predicted membrane-bound spermidine synthase
LKPKARDVTPFAIVGLAGLNLALVHTIALTELGALLGSNELVALLALSAYFLGMSGGYALSDKLSRRALIALGGATMALHATLPFSARAVAATLWTEARGLVPPFAFLLVLVGIAPFYAVFLPRLVDEQSRDQGSTSRLVRLYGTEIAGSAAGLLITVILTPARMPLILALHLAGIATLLLLTVDPPLRVRLASLLYPVVALYLLFFPSLDKASLEHFYAHRRKLRDPVLLASELSPYQRVDILEATTRRGGKARYLYLNGNLNYGTRSLHRHNLFVSILPNLVLGRPTRALVVAAGSLDSARYLAPRVGHLQIVEIDETVARLSREHLQAPRGGLPANFDLAFDDGKHFLGNYEGPRFDVISVDVPLPAHLQTAALHSERFFALARSRLAEGGLFSISLAGDLSPPSGEGLLRAPLEQRIVAGLFAVFRHVTVVMGAGTAFAWASDADLGLTSERVVHALRVFEDESQTRPVFGNPGVYVMDEGEARARSRGYSPIGEADMQMVLGLSWSKLRDRFYEEEAPR